MLTYWGISYGLVRVSKEKGVYFYSFFFEPWPDRVVWIGKAGPYAIYIWVGWKFFCSFCEEQHQSAKWIFPIFPLLCALSLEIRNKSLPIFPGSSACMMFSPCTSPHSPHHAGKIYLCVYYCYHDYEGLVHLLPVHSHWLYPRAGTSDLHSHLLL